MSDSDKLISELKEWLTENYENMTSEALEGIHEGIELSKINYISYEGTSLAGLKLKYAILNILSSENSWVNIRDAVLEDKLMIEGFWGIDTFNDESAFTDDIETFSAFFFSSIFLSMEDTANWYARFIQKVDSYGQLEARCKDIRLIAHIRKLACLVLDNELDKSQLPETPYDALFLEKVSVSQVQEVINYRVQQSMIRFKSRYDGDYLYDQYEYMCYPVEVLAPLVLLNNDSLIQELDWKGFELVCSPPDNFPDYKEPDWIVAFKKMANIK